jgi:heme-degrading monooxygenase HmoA
VPAGGGGVVSVIEITTFRLAAEADVGSFLHADRRVQTELVPNQPGFLRRTTARDGELWVVVVLWASRSDASAFDRAAQGHPAQAEFERHLESGSVALRHYDTLD